jgi:hypothetical protein
MPSTVTLVFVCFLTTLYSDSDYIASNEEVIHV